MLRSLIRCDGLQDWHVFVNVEPGSNQDRFGQICDALLPTNGYTVRINRRRLGVRGNPFDAIEHVFSLGSELNICLEEDLQVAPDILDLAEWYNALGASHLACLNFLAGACGNPGNLSDTHYPELFFETKCFNSYGLVLTRQNWDRLRLTWLGPDPGIYRFPDKQAHTPDHVAPRYLDIDGWDWAIYAHILQDPNLCVLQPVAARCQHKGVEGTFSNPDFHEQAFGHVALFDGSASMDSLRITPVAELPRSVRAHVECLSHAADLMNDLYESRYPREPFYLRWINRLETRLWGHPLTRR